MPVFHTKTIESILEPVASQVSHHPQNWSNFIFHFVLFICHSDVSFVHANERSNEDKDYQINVCGCADASSVFVIAPYIGFISLFDE